MLAACGGDTNPPCSDARLAPQPARYHLVHDFNSTGIRVRTPVQRNATVYFTDGDLLVFGMDAFPRMIEAVVLNKTFANVTFGNLTIRQLGTSQDLAVVVPVAVNLTDAQYAALARAEDPPFTFQLNITATDGGDNTTRALAVTQIVIDMGNDAVVVPNDYAGGHIPVMHATFVDHTYWERIFADTAVFLNIFVFNRRHPDILIGITDRDISSMIGDTYTYGLTVRNGSDAVIEGMLKWSHGANETLREQPSASFFRTIRFARDLTEADIGSYTVIWNITDARTKLRLPGTAAANGTFTMAIQQTPVIWGTLGLLAQNGRNANGRVLELDEDQMITSSDSLSAGIEWHGDLTFNLDYNRTLLGDFLMTPPPRSLNRHSLLNRLVVQFVRPTVQVRSPTDRHVGRHEVGLVATTAGGSSRRTATILVNNINDPTSAAAGPLAGENRGGRIVLPLFNLTDGDFEIPPRAAAIRARGGITVTSQLNLTFTRYVLGSAQTQSCALPRRERFIAGTLTDAQFRASTGLTLDLPATPACAAIYLGVAEEGVDNLTLTRAEFFGYTDPSGGPERTQDGLVIAVGELNITLGDDDGDGIREDDNCPLDHNPNQPDMDGDGIGDACEAVGVSDLAIVAPRFNSNHPQLDESARQ